MKKRLSCVAIALGLSLALPCTAANLWDIYQQSLANDVELSSAVNALKAKQEIAPQSRAQLLPRVDLEAKSNFNQQDAQGYPENDYNYHSYNFKLRQPLFNAERWFNLNAANATYSQAESEIMSAQQAFILRVAEAYFGLLKAHATLRAAQAQEEAFKKQYEQAVQRFEVGLIAITDQHEAKAGYDLATAERISAENELVIQKEVLTALTTRAYDTVDALQEGLPITKTEPAAVEDWLTAGFSKSPDLKAALAAADASKETLSEKKSKHLPTVDMVANKFYNKTGSADPLFDSQVNQDVVGVEFNLPLFEGGGTQSQVREATYNSMAANDRAELTKRRLQQQITSLYGLVNNDVQKVHARKQASISAASALEATQAGYEVGTRNIVELLQVTRTYYSAQKDYAISRYDYVLNTLRLKRATGVLREEDIVQVNAWLGDSSPTQNTENKEKSKESTPSPAPTTSANKAPAPATND